MRVAVIRGDLPGPLYLADLEVISQYDPAIEPVGQTFYISRPILSEMATALAGVAAGVLGTVNMTTIGTPIVINAGNRVLKLRLAIAPAAFVTCTIATGSYASVAALMVAVNAAIVTAGVAASVSLDRSGTYMVLKSTLTGPGAYVEVDTVADGSTFNALPGFAVGGASFTVPTAAAAITAFNPVGGPFSVSNALVLSTIGAGATNTQVTDIRDAVSLHLIETQVVIKSFQVGNLAMYNSAGYTPDRNRLPASAALSIVQDDGVTPFVAPLPNVTSAIIGGGNLTITGVGLGTNEIMQTTVRVSGTIAKVLSQAAIKHAGGSVSATQIVIPLSLLAGLVATTCFVTVKNDSLASASHVVA